VLQEGAPGGLLLKDLLGFGQKRIRHRLLLAPQPRHGEAPETPDSQSYPRRKAAHGLPQGREPQAPHGTSEARGERQRHVPQKGGDQEEEPRSAAGKASKLVSDASQTGHRTAAARDRAMNK